jgi:tight adherence protein C
MIVGIAVSMSVLSRTLRRRSADLMDASLADDVAIPPAVSERREAWLQRWLFLAGYRQPSAQPMFLLSTALGILLGIGIALLLSRSGAIALMGDSLASIPGGAGEALRAVIQTAPWILFWILAFTPTFVVRSGRRERVLRIEQDLPIVLDLFATLAEAGLSFDSSLARIQESQPQDRPLAAEFQTYQRELLAGVPRLRALRQLARRIEITSVTTLVSALIQAEQVGASLAATLRRQAEDARDRRKMRALLLAQALPVKLVFPLIACFLPGVFVATLGPALYQMVNIVGTVIPAGR